MAQSSKIRGRPVAMKRWDGRSRITTDWSINQTDPELNFADGNLFVYLHEPGRSDKEPSFRVHYDYIATSDFDSLAHRALRLSNSYHSDPSFQNGHNREGELYELYLPAPSISNPDAGDEHYLAIRNFLAWVHDRPLAGKALGASLLQVMQQAEIYRPESTVANVSDMLAYLDRRGYNDFRECVDHALAALLLAETYHIDALWVDAFAHAVGMHHGLQNSIEFEPLSRASKAMITRGRLEVDVRLDRVGKSVQDFFENDLTGSTFGFNRIAQEHTDQFRSFLHTYFIEIHGFWPPLGFDSSFSLRRSLYRSMYVELRALYQYLVDQGLDQSNSSIQMDGGLRVLHIIQAFDQRYRLDTLPNPLPLLPQPHPQDSTALALLKWRAEKDSRKAAAVKSLLAAANHDPEVMKAGLVRRFIQFEKESVGDIDPIDMTEGRKVRWILVYAVFQILASVIAAPKEVQQTEGLSYPLCCQKPSVMPWALNTRAASSTPSLRSVSTMKAKAAKVVDSPQPDIKSEIDYLTCKPISVPSSAANTPAEAANSASIKSSPSIKSFKSFKSMSLRRMLHRKGSDRPSSSQTTSSVNTVDSATTTSSQTTTRGFQEILIVGYGNGMGETAPPVPKIPDLSPARLRTPKGSPKGSPSTLEPNEQTTPTRRNPQPSTTINGRNMASGRTTAGRSASSGRATPTGRISPSQRITPAFGLESGRITPDIVLASSGRNTPPPSLRSVDVERGSRKSNIRKSSNKPTPKVGFQIPVPELKINDKPTGPINNTAFIKSGRRTARNPLSRPAPLSQLPRRNPATLAPYINPLTPSLPESPTVPTSLPTASSISPILTQAPFSAPTSTSLQPPFPSHSFNPILHATRTTTPAPFRSLLSEPLSPPRVSTTMTLPASQRSSSASDLSASSDASASASTNRGSAIDFFSNRAAGETETAPQTPTTPGPTENDLEMVWKNRMNDDEANKTDGEKTPTATSVVGMRVTRSLVRTYVSVRGERWNTKDRETSRLRSTAG